MRGNTGAGPLKALDEKSLAAGGQRWRFIPLHNRLKNASARPASLPSAQFDSNLTDVHPDDTSFSHLAAAFTANSETNITLTYTEYLRQVRPLSYSLPLIYRNRKRLVTLTLEALQISTRNAAEATPAIANCLAALSKDLGPQQFHPFFPKVIEIFALILDTNGSQEQLKRGNVIAKPSADSVLWDPEVSMIPLFAALAEMTKDSLQCMASDPTRTIQDLLPLLSHSHYRVREMTAESCLGYLLRKTRDLSVLKKLTRNLLEVSYAAEAADLMELKLLDGLGASLYEAVRLPSGRLHARASEILDFALQRLDEHSRNTTQLSGHDSGDRILKVISLCFSRLCRHLTNPTDIRTTSLLFLKAGDDAKKQANAIQIGNIAFLSQRWLQNRGNRVASLLDRVSHQKFLSAFSDWVGRFIFEPRIIYECLGGICTVMSASSENNVQESSRRILCSALAKVSSSTESKSLLCAIAVLLKTQTSNGNLIECSIARVFAGLCDQLAKVSAVELLHAPTSGVSVLALDRALTFLRSASECDANIGSRYADGFRVPTLEAQIISVLSHPSFVATRDVQEQSSSHVIQNGLGYLSIVQVSNSETAFLNLLSAEGLGLDDCGRLLEAVLFQFNGRIADMPPSLKARVTVVVDRLLESVENSSATSAIITALTKYTRLFPLEAKKLFAGRRQRSEDYIAILSVGLSSLDSLVRLCTADLLFCISRVLADGFVPGQTDDEEEVMSSDAVQPGIEGLRSSLISDDAGFTGFFAALRCACRTLRSLSKTDDSLRLLREIARVLRNSQNVSRVVVVASTHFSIGLFRTPFKTLWGCAANVWSAAASHLSKDAMAVIIQKLREAEFSLISKSCANQGNSADVDDGALVFAREDSDVQESKAKDMITACTDDDQPLPSNPHVKQCRTDSMRSRAKSITAAAPVHKKTNGLAVLQKHWNGEEWRKHCDDTHNCSCSVSGCSPKKAYNMGILEGFTDDLTFLREVLQALSQDHQHAFVFRSQIVSSYLRLDPTLFSRRVGNSIATSFAVLLEKLGGLKRGNKDDLERSLLCRLLSDLTRSCPPLQIISLKCLSASRVNPLKRYRESFIRLIQDASFRDELSALADTMLPNLSLDEKGNALDKDNDTVLDVLLRICFSKMRGKVNRTESRRAAALSFVVSRLPVMLALPRIINLVLAPIANIVNTVQVEVRGQAPIVDRSSFPGLNVQMGLLTSIESIMKQCHRSLDSPSWQRIASACFALLLNAGTGSAGKNMRSRSVRILADMCHARASESSFLVLPVFAAMRNANFAVEGRTAGGGIPSLLYFMSAVYGANLVSIQKSAVLQEPWSVVWCLHLLKAEDAELQTVDMSLGVAQGLVTLILGDAVASSERPDVLFQVPSCYSMVTSELLSSLQALLRRLVDNLLRDRNRRKSWDPVFNKALGIVERMVQTSSLESTGLVTLFEGLVVYLENTFTFSNSYEQALGVLTIISEQLCARKSLEDKEQIGSHIRQVRFSALRLLPLFAKVRFVSQPKAYLELCRLLASLDAPDLSAVAASLRAMNAMKSSQVDSPDLDKRIDALNGVIRAFKDALDELAESDSSTLKEVRISIDEDSADEPAQVKCYADAIIALVYGCIASVMFDDVAVRGTASYALQLIGKWSALSQSNSAKTCQHRIFKLLVEAVVCARTGTVRREYTRALAKVVRQSQCIWVTGMWPGYPMFSLLKSMCSSKDLDSDFFENVVHLQAHRRSRALRQIQKEVLNADMETVMGDEIKYEALASFSSKFSLPLGIQIVLELSEDEPQRNVSSRHAESRESAGKDVAVWAVDVVGASARWLQWPELKSCICDLLRRIRHCKHEKQAQALYKLLVAVVKAFPHLDRTRKSVDTSIKAFLMESLLPTLLNHITSGGVEGDLVEITDTAPTHIQNKRRSSASGVFRAPVASAVAHLLTRLPSSDVDVFIPRLVTPLANALRSRKTALLDSAKKALTSIVLTLGSRYLPYVLQQVLSVLSQGFRKDACVYVIHSILIGIRDSAKKLSKNENGDALTIDEAAWIIAMHLSEELQRGMAVTVTDFEDPNASTFLQKQASARAARAYDCAEILSEYILFDKSARIVVQPFWKLLGSTSSAKLVTRIENVLHRMLTGFTKNRSMKPDDALKYCYELISAQTDSQSLGKSVESSMSTSTISDQAKDHLQKATKNGILIITFGLQLLCNVVSKNALLFGGTSVKSRELQAMVEPFLPLIVQALQTKHDRLTVVALRASQKLMKLPLSNKALTGQMMSERIVDVISQNAGLVTHSDELFNSCLRAAAVLMYEVGDGGFKALSRERVEALISISCKCMESGGLEARSAALALLRAAVASRIMIPAVYDAIERVNEMAIHSQSSSLRSSCTALSVQFAVSFPLGSRRVRQHLEFFVRNLNYDLSTGRLAALEVIRTIVLKFPGDVLKDECQYLFVALAASAARDSHPDCRSCASRALQSLFERVPTGRDIANMLQMASLLAGVKTEMTSLDEEIQIVHSVGDDVQLSGAFALSTACKSGRMAPLQLNMIVRVLVVALTNRQDSIQWETTYALLQALEVAFDVQQAASQSEHLEVQKHTRPLWEDMPSFLLHEHPWIRLSSARLLGSHLSAHGNHSAAAEKRPEIQFSVLWDSSSNLVRDTLKSCCSQLEAISVSEDLGQQCLKNLLCIANVIFWNPVVGDLAPQEGLMRAGEANHREAVGELATPNSKSQNPGLYWLLCRMSGLALRAGEEAVDMLRRGCALRFLLVTTKWWGFDFVRLHKTLYIAPIVKILEHIVSVNASREGSRTDGTTVMKAEDMGMEGLKEIAGALQETLVQGLGGSAYYEVYQILRNERDDAKQARKRQAAFELAVNPERAAKRRRKKAELRKKKKRGSVR